MLEILGPAREMEFDAAGNVEDVLVEQFQEVHAGH